jgi:hypothetical protein|tara:strand:+ start:230 stop:463 length:234 start_codon:yes stop_codon:yes gene_type:complete
MKGRQAKRMRQESALKRTEAQLAEYKTGLTDQQNEVKRAKKEKDKPNLTLAQEWVKTLTKKIERAETTIRNTKERMK